MSKFEKAKGWIKEHGEEIAVYGTAVAATAAVVVLAIWAAKEEAKEIDEHNAGVRAMQQKIEAAISRGDSVLPGGPNGYWIIPRNIES